MRVSLHQLLAYGLLVTSGVFLYLGIAPALSSTAPSKPSVVATDEACTRAAVQAVAGNPIYPLPGRCVDRVDPEAVQAAASSFADRHLTDISLMVSWCASLERWTALNGIWVDIPDACWRARIVHVLKQRLSSHLLGFYCQQLKTELPEVCLLAPENETVA